MVLGFLCNNTLDKHIELDTDEQIYFDSYDQEALGFVLDTQHKIIYYMKKKHYNKLYQIMIIVDYFANDPKFTRESKLLHSLFTRGRHSMISCVVSTQKFRSIAQIIRISATELFIYRLRNYKDLEAFLEEVSAVVDKETLLELYRTATSEPYSFLYVKLTARDKHEMFFSKL
ncbi:MAG: ATPase/DNA packaging protein [Candidatus Fonsibacter sp.]